jgi:hypothetical protein
MTDFKILIGSAVWTFCLLTVLTFPSMSHTRRSFYDSLSNDAIYQVMVDDQSAFVQDVEKLRKGILGRADARQLDAYRDGVRRDWLNIIFVRGLAEAHNNDFTPELAKRALYR